MPPPRLPQRDGRKTSKKQQPRVPVPEERVRRHFKSLVAQIDGGHLKNGIKTCDKILRLVPDDPDALQTKLALLLHSEQYAAALALAESLTNEPAPSPPAAAAAAAVAPHAPFPLAFGKAYALYRLNRESDASAAVVLASIHTQTAHQNRGVMHMEAQIEYRRGNYEKAQRLYSDLFDSSQPHSDEQSDSLTNLTAAQTHVDFLQAGFLRALGSLPAAVTASLEDAPPPPPPPSLPSVHHPVLAIRQEREQEQEQEQEQKEQASGPRPAPQKKARMSRVPKGVVPGVTPPPDPERWLKKSERTNIPHHGGKRRKALASGGATQGSLVVEAAPPKSGGKSKKRK